MCFFIWEFLEFSLVPCQKLHYYDPSSYQDVYKHNFIRPCT